MLSRCFSKYSSRAFFVVFLPHIAPSRPPTNLTLLPLGKDGLELRWKVSVIALVGVKQAIVYNTK